MDHVIIFKEHDRLFYIPFQKIISFEEKHLDTASIKGQEMKPSKEKSVIYSCQFLTSLLEVIDLCMDDCLLFYNELIHPKDRISTVMKIFEGKTFSRKEYMKFHTDISTATSSRVLAEAIYNKGNSPQNRGREQNGVSVCRYTQVIKK